MFGIRMTETGGPDVLVGAELEDPVPRPSDVVVELAAAGINYIDTYHRSGLYPVTLPYTPGLEGAGVVTTVGAEVEGVAVGDRVAWSSVPGSYAQRVRMPAALAIPVPAGVELGMAAAVLLQGMTAHYLALDTFPLGAGDRCLIHAGAGGVGLLLIQVAKIRGAEVFTTVGSEEKAALVQAAGADHAILYRDEDFAAAVEAIAGPRPLDVVYDGVGKDVFDTSLGLLRRRGTMVSFGNSSGPVDPVSPLRLAAEGSLFLTRPSLADHIATREELTRRAGDVLGWVADGSLAVRVAARLPLAEAAEAHRLLEGRLTTGKLLLVP